MFRELEDQLSRLWHGDHLCLFHNDHAERMTVIVPFFKDGFARGERCIYVVDEEGREEVVQALQAVEVDVTWALKCGALLLPSRRETYLRTGKFDPQDMIALLRQMQEQAWVDGFPGVRGTAEMTETLRSEDDWDQIFQYEALLNDALVDSRLMVICQYNHQRFSPSVLREALRTHPTCILDSRIRDSLYYEPFVTESSKRTSCACPIV